MEERGKREEWGSSYGTENYVFGGESWQVMNWIRSINI
jgi:hypothetical protein